jgi:hypothetical protein
MKNKIFGLIFVVCGISVITVAFASDSLQSSQNEAHQKIVSLLKEKRDILQKKMDLLKKQFQSGTVTFDSVILATNQLLDAEFDLAATKEERIVICEKKLKNAQEYERIIKDKHKSGFQVLATAVLDARAACLDAEIQLIREKSDKK